MKALPVRSVTLAVLALSTSLAACGKKTAPEQAAQPGPAPAGSNAAAVAPETPSGQPAGAPASAPAPVLTGTVLETMDSGGYTYMKLKNADGEVWAAVTKAKVAAGQTVTIASPMQMDGFESKTLNRKFDRIVFGSLASEGAAAAPAAPQGMPGAALPGMPGGMGAAPAMPAAMAAQHAAAASGPEVTEKISVTKAEGADARTIAELYGQRAALKGKTVTVRGKVVKFNGGIMGKNWVHLRDGSGSPEGKDNDLTVTTNDSVAKGDVVVVKGTVAVDRDFGAGYTYAVIVEGAKVTK